jgi:CheY-like chemotaxis protein
VSVKSIQPIQAFVLYCSFDRALSHENKISLFFSKLFTDFEAIDSVAALQNRLANQEEKHAVEVVILDLRGEVGDFLTYYAEIYEAIGSRVSMIVYEREHAEKVVALAEEGVMPCCVFPVPWNKGIPERVIRTVRQKLESNTQEASPSYAQLNKGGNREYIEKLNAANSFYADHAKAMLIDAKRIVRLSKIMSQDEEKQEIPFMGRLLQYAEVLEGSAQELLQFSTQNWHTYQYRTIFDINTVLDAVSSTSIPFLKGHDIELIFEVHNNVPARLKGYPLGMVSSLVSILELITHAKIQGELIMRISLEEQQHDDGELLSFQFMQNHYRGSVTNVVLSAIQGDQQFKKLLEQMDEIDGSVLHSDHANRGSILQLSFRVQMFDRRSYRLPSKEIMDKTVLIMDERKKNAEVLQGMLRYFHIFSSISTQADEAIEHIRDHEFDVVIVTERLAKRCAKSCKQARDDEKFIVINTDKGINSSYLGLDLADSFLNEPYTHKGIFNALIDIFSEESLEGRMEDVETLKSYLNLIAKNRRMVYVGSNGMTVRSMEVLLEDSDMRLETMGGMTHLGTAEAQYDFVLLDVDANMLRSDMAALEAYLHQGESLSRNGKIVCVVSEEVEEEELELIAPFTFVITYIQEPIDPETFYKILLDWAMSLSV